MAQQPRGKSARAQERKAVAAVRRAEGTGWGWWAGVLLVVLAVLVILVVFNRPHRSASGTGTEPPRVAPMTMGIVRDSPPPWPLPPDPTEAVHAAGLPLLNNEGTVEHIHAHLDVRVNGHPVPVPDGIGIDETSQQISPLHTHDHTGVIHIESPTPAPFSLGQLATQWQVRLDQTHLGGLSATGGNTVQAFVNGRPVPGNPAAILIHRHDEIALIYGLATQLPPVPARYAFPAGE